MGEEKTRPMCPDDWAPVPIERGRYFNREHALTGYQRVDGQGGTALHPVCGVEDRLRETHSQLRDAHQGVRVTRHHVKMPYWDPKNARLPDNYAFVKAPERLTTTSITVVTVPQDRIKLAQMGFYFQGSRLPSLRERMAGVSFQGIAGNLGYFMTRGLIDDKFRWSHNVRYPDFPLPPLLSYIGFHLFRDMGTGAVCGSFAGAHPGAVGIRDDGVVEIIPSLEIEAYRVSMWGVELSIRSINDPDAVEDVMVFTPGLWTPDVGAHVTEWETYAPEIPVPGRVNVFIANEGDGAVPVERVVKVWEGRAPLPSFGAVLSFDREFFEQHFVNAETFGCLDQRVKIEPVGGTDLSSYVQVMAGFVPAVVDGQHINCVETVGQVQARMQEFGNALSPVARCGRETNNFDPYVREPAGVLIQTQDHIGWVLFDGRHELSIGASVVDVARILKQLEEQGVFDGVLRHALFVDGGSAMKVYAIKSDGMTVALDLLNRVAVGSRNGPGVDLDGLNLYTLLNLAL
jgi:hypothetical protein